MRIIQSKNREPIRIKISAEAARDHRELFGAMKRKEIQMELKYYITKFLQAKKVPAEIINYDNEKAIFLLKIDDSNYEVAGFGRVSEWCS